MCLDIYMYIGLCISEINNNSDTRDRSEKLEFFLS